MIDNRIDIKENYIRDLHPDLISLLLVDKTTNNNLIWATDNYQSKGYGYNSKDCISVSAISGKRGSIIKPRIDKSKEEIKKRIRDKAEVFTPSWVCNSQNNLVDEAWFGYKFAFNVENGNRWTTNIEPVVFPEGKTWQDYVKANRLEITCGEAPYVVSRYDTVSGEIIPIRDRIGLLDRKIRIVNENAQSDEEWLAWVKWSFKSVYAYDWQGDNVILARENLLFTFIDYYLERFGSMPSTDLLFEIADIIVWNIWQMDGLKCVVPHSCHNEVLILYTLFGEENHSTICPGCKNNNIKTHNGIYCKVMDWEKGKSVKFVTLVSGRNF